MAVTEIPVGQNYRREELADRGQPESLAGPSGKYGMRCIMVEVLPDLADQEDDVIYFVKPAS